MLLSAIALQQDHAGTAILEDNRLDVPFNEPTLDNPGNRLMACQFNEVLRLTDWLTEHRQSISALISRFYQAHCQQRKQAPPGDTSIGYGRSRLTIAMRSEGINVNWLDIKTE